jgi:hypothetical protein
MAWAKGDIYLVMNYVLLDEADIRLHANERYSDGVFRFTLTGVIIPPPPELCGHYNPWKGMPAGQFVMVIQSTCLAVIG